MNAEELCKKMQEEKKADSENCYEEEMSSQEYLNKYFNTPYFSFRKYFRLCDEERRKFSRYY